MSKKKQKKQSNTSTSSKLISANIPTTIFRDRSLSVLESLVEHLKDELQLSFHEIAEMLNRDDRTIWTCYTRAKKKRRKNGKKA